MSATRITANAPVGHVRRNASGAVVARTPTRAQEGTASRCGIEGPAGATYRRPLAAVTTAAAVTAAASATSPTEETPDRTGRRATDRTREASRAARPAPISLRELCVTCPLSLDARGKGVAPQAEIGTSAGRCSAGNGTQVASGGRRDDGGPGRSVPGMDTLVQLTNVSKQYGGDGSPAVAHVSMEVG